VLSGLETAPDLGLLTIALTQADGPIATSKAVDHALVTSATDLRGRVAWRELLDQAANRRADVILVWKLDRAFRSVAHMAATV